MRIPMMDGSEESSIRLSRFAVGIVGFGLVIVLIVAIATPRKAPTPHARARSTVPPVRKAESLSVQPSERSDFTPPSKEVERRSLADASVMNLVANVVFASARGDEATLRALVRSLARHKERALELLAAELSKARNEKTAAGLRSAMEELK